ncbi:hypothetical protein VTI74DRAFT_5483 [Chaetomium olivicolor]
MPGSALCRTSSVDLIAEQYRAVLESRRSSTYFDTHLEPPIPSYDVENESRLLEMVNRQRNSGSYHYDGTPMHPPVNTTDSAKPSPTSDDGTLVSFQDDTVYFKPLSLSPEPESSSARPFSAQSFADDNVSLQICLDLLTRDLSSAIGGRRQSMGTSALQVWVMIEAYEKLRDQMAELSQSNEQARAMEMMFDMWLRALYSVHESLTGEGKTRNNDDGATLGGKELD